MAGIGYYQFIEKLEADFDARKEEIVENLQALTKQILRPESFMVSYTGEEESLEETQTLCRALKVVLPEEQTKLPEKSLVCVKKTRASRPPGRYSMWRRPAISKSRACLHRCAGDPEGCPEL